MFFNLLTKDLSITVEKYRLLAKTLTIPDIIILDDLDTSKFVTNEDVITPLQNDDPIVISQ